MNQEIIFGIIRHVLTIAGGFLVSKGKIDSSGLETLVGGITAVIGVVWSMLHKQNTAVTTAIASIPMVTTDSTVTTITTTPPAK